MNTDAERTPNVVGSWLNYDRIRIEKSIRREPDGYRKLEKRRAKRAKEQKTKRAAEWQAEAAAFSMRGAAKPEQRFLIELWAA